MGACLKLQTDDLEQWVFGDVALVRMNENWLPSRNHAVALVGWVGLSALFGIDVFLCCCDLTA